MPWYAAAAPDDGFEAGVDSVPMNDLRRAVEFQAGSLREAVEAVLRSGWFVQGPFHDEFEWTFADFVGVDHCVGVASGTSALELGLLALGRDGAVLTAANAGGYTMTAAAAAGYAVRFADVDESTLCLNKESVEKALDGSVSVVVVTHLYGRMAPVEEIVALCDERGVMVLEDCAQSVGAERSGRKAGSVGHAAAFSFYPTKNLGALGDAGAVVTNDAAVADRVRRLRQYGWGAKYEIVERRGGNSRLDELQAAILLRNMRGLEAGNARRVQIARLYSEAAAGSDRIRFLPVEPPGHVAHLAVGVSDDRDGVRETLRSHGIMTDVHYPVPDHRQPAYASEHAATDLPVTETAVHRVLSVPCFPELTETEVDLVCHALSRL